MPPQAPWSPNAHAFAQHQFSHVANFWKQGRQASFRLEALPGGRAELNITFQLPPAAEVIPPPSHVSQVPPQRPIHPLFPNGWAPKGSGGADCKTQASPKKVSSRQRKSYRRSVLHRAALAAPSLPPPKNGSLRQAAQACVERLQAASVSNQNVKKRPHPDFPSIPSPSSFPPLAQRIRSDIQVGESEIEYPEKEILRSSPSPENTPSPISPRAKGLPLLAPLVFTPVPPQQSSCLNCDAQMTVDHQCEAADSDGNLEDVKSEHELYPGGDESKVIGIVEVEVDEKESVEIAKAVEEDESVEAEQVIESAEQKLSEFRMRWIKRLNKCTDDKALKTKLLECLEVAYLAPLTVLSNADFNEVKDMFFQDDLPPARFLDELQKLLKRVGLGH